MGAQNEIQTTHTLAHYFDDSAAAVRRTFARIEEGFVLPAVELFKALFSAHPVLFVFFSIFVSLSLFPFLAYIILSCATLSVALTVALCLAFMFSAGVFIFLGGILLSIFGLTLLLSGFLTSLAISTYFAARLISNLRLFGRHGFGAWYQEVTSMLSPFSPHLSPADEDAYTSQDSKGLTGGAKDGHEIDTEPLPYEQ